MTERELEVWIAEKLFSYKWLTVTHCDSLHLAWLNCEEDFERYMRVYNTDEYKYFSVVEGFSKGAKDITGSDLPKYLSDTTEWEGVVDRLVELGDEYTEIREVRISSKSKDPYTEGGKGLYKVCIYLNFDGSLHTGEAGANTRQEARYKALIKAKPYIEELINE